MVSLMTAGDSPSNPYDEQDENPFDVPRIGEDRETTTRSRTSMKRERVENEKALTDLVTDLLELNEGAWEALEVPPRAIETLLDARKMKSHGARARHMRLIRATLRGGDWLELRRRIDLRRMGIVAAAPQEDIAHWTEHLMIHGDAGLARFVETYPDTDRKRLRQVLRNVRAAPEQKRGKMRLTLEQALQHIINQAKDED